jgi:hypothetical protein
VTQLPHKKILIYVWPGLMESVGSMPHSQGLSKIAFETTVYLNNLFSSCISLVDQCGSTVNCNL